MHPRALELGAVYQTEWGNDPLRVIAFDAEVVMYGAWLAYANAWSSDSPKPMSYYRLPTSLLMGSSTYIRTDPYTDAEFRRHRPDLPLSLARHLHLSWTAESPDLASIEEALGDQLPDGANIPARRLLEVPAIVLEPFGPKGGQRRGTVIEAADGKTFSEAELIWHAWRLQAPFVRTPARTTGIGIYRSGIQRGLPSYYVWGSTSMMGQ